MDATLNLLVKLLSFKDSPANSNPRLRAVDWDRECGGVMVTNPDAKGYKLIVAENKLIFDGARVLTVDGTTEFDLSLLSTNSSTYRITHAAGTAPGFRTGRGLTLNSCVLTFQVLTNNLVSLSVPTLTPSDFTNVLVGDWIFIPHSTTGDAANVINVLNAGYWQVLSKIDNQNLTIGRAIGGTFEGVSETVTLTDNSQMRAFSGSGVQIGDTMVLSAGFSIRALKSWTVTAVTDAFVEFVSTVGLPDEAGIIPNAGIQFYTDNKRILYIEADQECVVRLNGDTGGLTRLAPIEPGNANKPAVFLMSGSVFSLSIENKSTSILNALVVTAE